MGEQGCIGEPLDERAHLPSGNFNAKKCAAYLRFAGVEVSDEQEAAWVATEAETRARRRAHNREIKRSCGHFRTYWSKVYHRDGLTRINCCLDCGRAIEYAGASMPA